MAFLYPVLHNPVQFIQKRYGRIIPVFTLVSLYIWLTHWYQIKTWYLNAGILVGLALLTYILYQVFNRIDRKRRYLSILFYAFVVLQLAMLIFSLTILPKIMIAKTIIVSDSQKQLIDLLSTITMVSPFAQGIVQLSNVFWSLVPEMYFYLLYPFMVVPIITITKKQKLIVQLLVVVAITKILLDLDNTLSSILSFHTMNIARANGFVAGVTAGSIYRSKGKLWTKMSKILSNNIISVIVFMLLIFIQWGDTTIRDGKEIWFMNYYYLISSWIFAVVILAAVTPNTLVQRIFQNKFLVFSGMVSYSLYLIHTHTIPWTHPIVQVYLKHIPFKAAHPLFELGFSLGLTLFISFILYKTVEFLYFEHTRRTKPIHNAEKIADKPQTITRKKILIGTGIAVGIIVLIYSGGYAPSLFASRHRMSNNFMASRTELRDSSLKTTITSRYDNLSVVIVNMTYIKNAEDTRTKSKNPASLMFRLYKKGSSTPIFESTRHAYQVEGEPHFPFGFPTIKDSKNKEYIVELAVKGGSEKDHVNIDTSANSMVTLYTNDKREILKKPYKIVANRALFAFSNADAVFAVATVMFLAFLAPFRPSGLISSDIYRKRVQ